MKVFLNPSLEEIKQCFYNDEVWQKMCPGERPEDVPIPTEGWTYIKFEDEEGLASIVRYRDATKILCEFHGAIMPRLWHGRSHEVIKELCIQLLTRTSYKKIMTTVPENCLHALKFWGKMGFKAEGYIDRAIYYNDKLVGLYILTVGQE